MKKPVGELHMAAAVLCLAIAGLKVEAQVFELDLGVLEV